MMTRDQIHFYVSDGGGSFFKNAQERMHRRVPTGRSAVFHLRPASSDPLTMSQTDGVLGRRCQVMIR